MNLYKWLLVGCVGLGLQAIAPKAAEAKPPARSIHFNPIRFNKTAEEIPGDFPPLEDHLAEDRPTENHPIESRMGANSVPGSPGNPGNPGSPGNSGNSGKITEITEPDGTIIILPPGYSANRPYPALVLMPYTNRTALHMFNWGIYDAYHQRKDNAFVIIMPPGQGSSANWSGSGWTALVNEYEAYVQQDLAPLVQKYNIAPDQLAIGGFSLGGDLSWTLSLRNPDVFSGAIVMGSMSNYRDRQSAQQLARNDFRYFMVMGGYDGNRGAMYDALSSLDRHNIDYHYEEVSSAGHGNLPERMQRDLFLSAMDYVLAGE